MGFFGGGLTDEEEQLQRLKVEQTRKSPAEEKYEAAFYDIILPEFLSERGIDFVETPVAFEESKAYKDKLKEIAPFGYGPALAELGRAEYEKNPEKTQTPVKRKASPQEISLIQKDTKDKIQDIRNKVARGDLNSEEGDRLIQRTQSLADKTIRSGKPDDFYDNLDQMEVDELTLQATKKVLSGDLSLTKSQNEFITQGYQKIRDEYFPMIDRILDQISLTKEQTISATQGAFEADISVIKAGERRETAQVEESKKQIQESLKGLRETVRANVESSEAAARGDLKEFARQQEIAFNKKASLLGRSSQDQTFQRERDEIIARNVTELGLKFGVTKANVESQFAELFNSLDRDTADKILSIMDVGVQREIAATGLRGERIIGATSEAGQKREVTLGRRADVALGLAQEEQGVRRDVARFLPETAGFGVTQSQLSEQLNALRRTPSAEALAAATGVQQQVNQFRDVGSVGFQKDKSIFEQLTGGFRDVAVGIGSLKGGGNTGRLFG